MATPSRAPFEGMASWPSWSDMEMSSWSAWLPRHSSMLRSMRRGSILSVMSLPSQVMR